MIKALPLKMHATLAFVFDVDDAFENENTSPSHPSMPFNFA